MYISVEGRNDIGDIAVHKQLSRPETDDLVGRHPAIGAADPEILRGLGLAEPLEVLGISQFDPFCPSAVVGKKFRQKFHINDYAKSSLVCGNVARW